MISLARVYGNGQVKDHFLNYDDTWLHLLLKDNEKRERQIMRRQDASYITSDAASS